MIQEHQSQIGEILGFVLYPIFLLLLLLQPPHNLDRTNLGRQNHCNFLTSFIHCTNHSLRQVRTQSSDHQSSCRVSREKQRKYATLETIWHLFYQKVPATLVCHRYIKAKTAWALGGESSLEFDCISSFYGAAVEIVIKM